MICVPGVHSLTLRDSHAVVVDLLNDARLKNVVEGVENQIEIAHAGHDLSRYVTAGPGTLAA